MYSPVAISMPRLHERKNPWFDSLSMRFNPLTCSKTVTVLSVEQSLTTITSRGMFSPSSSAIERRQEKVYSTLLYTGIIIDTEGDGCSGMVKGRLSIFGTNFFF